MSKPVAGPDHIHSFQIFIICIYDVNCNIGNTYFSFSCGIYWKAAKLSWFCSFQLDLYQYDNLVLYRTCEIHISHYLFHSCIYIYIYIYTPTTHMHTPRVPHIHTAPTQIPIVPHLCTRCPHAHAYTRSHITVAHMH